MTLDKLWDLQGRQCAICGQECDPDVDHDHSTGLVRGLLCRRCNTTEGHASHAVTPRFVAYRLLPPAKRFGLEMLYSERGSDPYMAAMSKRRREDWIRCCIRLSAGFDDELGLHPSIRERWRRLGLSFRDDQLAALI